MGCGEKTAVHILVSTIQGVMAPRVERFVAKIDGLINELDGKARALLAAGADLEARDGEGRTALIGAATRHTVPRVPRTPAPGARVVGDLAGLVRALLAAGADVNAQDNEDRTSLAAAIARDRTFGAAGAAIPVLVDHGADLDLADAAGMTPLMHAARCDNAALCRLLLEAWCRR